MASIQSICVYCGSSPGNDDAYMTAGKRLGEVIAGAGLRLVYGGGNKGIMGAVAAGALAAGGQVTGIIPRFLIPKEASDSSLDHLDELVITEGMHERKHTMFEKSDAFVALPGGLGTLEEIVEIMTWAQLGQHRKPIVFCNVKSFWDPMVKLLDHMRNTGFVHTGHLVRPIVADGPDDAVQTILDRVAEDQPPSPGNAAIIEKM